MKEDYKVRERNNGFWYYKLPGERRTTTALTAALKRRPGSMPRRSSRESLPKKHSRILKEFTKDFFIWGTCKWTKRQLKKGKRFSQSHATDRRAFLVNHIYPKFGGRYIDSLSPEEVEVWLIDLDHISNHTKNKIN